MTLQDRPELTTQRVSNGGRAPLVVVLAVVAFVAVLVWKPWVGPAAPSPSPGRVGALPSPSVAPSPTDSTVSVPATPTPLPVPLVPNVDVDWLFPFVQCDYGPAGQDSRSLLSSLTIVPPLVVLQPPGIGGVIARVTWRARVETNLEQSLFTAPWDPVSTTRRRPAPDRANLDEPLHSLSISYAKGPIGGTIVARVEIVVEWLGSDGQLLGSESVVPTSYRYGSAGPILPEGCHTDI